MLLAVNVGNSQTHIGVFDRAELAHEWRAFTDPRRTPDELALLFAHFLDLADLSFSRQITGVVLSSVVPRATTGLREMTVKYFGFAPVVVEPKTKSGIDVTAYTTILGADRLANAVGAHARWPDEHVVVVDVGTAITVDAVSSDGKFLGGAIAPGVDAAATGLYSSTALIAPVELRPPVAALGTSTSRGVEAGIVYGLAALTDGLVERIVDEVGGRAHVVATGGAAGMVVPHCRRVDAVDPMLTLNGLRLIYDRNAGRGDG
ncbi:MAG TPA: type III pantothenate kinase [Actinomycetota bacterium]|nr:type III pantothenate kinase [Actinomycetota bacterium]